MKIPGTDECAEILKMPPKISAVYFLIKDGAVVYVGQSKNLIARRWIHEHDKDFDSVLYISCDQSDLLELEDYWLIRLRPALHSDEAIRQAVLRTERRRLLYVE